MTGEAVAKDFTIARPPLARLVRWAALCAPFLAVLAYLFGQLSKDRPIVYTPDS